MSGLRQKAIALLLPKGKPETNDLASNGSGTAQRQFAAHTMTISSQSIAPKSGANPPDPKERSSRLDITAKLQEVSFQENPSDAGLQRNQVEKEVMQLLQQLRDGGLIAIAGQPDAPNVEFKK